MHAFTLIFLLFLIASVLTRGGIHEWFGAAESPVDETDMSTSFLDQLNENDRRNHRGVALPRQPHP